MMMTGKDLCRTLIGTVENHCKKWLKTQQTFVKIAKFTAKSRQKHDIKSRAQRPL